LSETKLLFLVVFYSLIVKSKAFKIAALSSGQICVFMFGGLLTDYDILSLQLDFIGKIYVS